MNNTIRLSTTLATAAALSFTTSASATSPNMVEGIPTRIQCQDANSCKGQSACNTMANGCQGRNDCQGKGWLYIDGQSKGEAERLCKKAREKVRAEKEKRDKEDFQKLNTLNPTKNVNP